MKMGIRTISHTPMRHFYNEKISLNSTNVVRWLCGSSSCLPKYYHIFCTDSSIPSFCSTFAVISGFIIDFDAFSWLVLANFNNGILFGDTCPSRQATTLSTWSTIHLCALNILLIFWSSGTKGLPWLLTFWCILCLSFEIHIQIETNNLWVVWTCMYSN